MYESERKGGTRPVRGFGNEYREATAGVITYAKGVTVYEL